MDGENNGSKPYEQMDDLGIYHPYFWFNTPIQHIQTLSFLVIWLPVILREDEPSDSWVAKWRKPEIPKAICSGHP